MAYTTIDDPSAHFQTLLYTGNATGSRALTNDGNSDLQPDWLWVKERNNARNNNVWDSSRGVTKSLRTNLSNAEATNTTNDTIVSFNSDGFTVGDDTDGVGVNLNSNTYVAWQWKANGGTTTTNSAGANGADHESVYQANDTAGFSIVTYTSDNQSGDTIIKHGLSTAPTFMIHKARNASSTIWWVYHKNLGNGGYVNLEQTNTNQTGSTNVWRNTAPTSSVFKVGLDSIAPADGRTMVAYCFAPIQGYSKFGTFSGAPEAGRPFVYTGFKPAWLMIRRIDATTNARWYILDNVRNPSNVVNLELYANESSAEATRIAVDFLSNGFKLRTSASGYSVDGGTFIYMAFAEHPFVSSKGVPTTAR
jgi:hypothetical protein